MKSEDEDLKGLDFEERAPQSSARPWVSNLSVNAINHIPQANILSPVVL